MKLIRKMLRAIGLFFSTMKLRRLYKKVQKTADKKLTLRVAIRDTQLDFLGQVDKIKTKYGIKHPKQLIEKKRDL